MDGRGTGRDALGREVGQGLKLPRARDHGAVASSRVDLGDPRRSGSGRGGREVQVELGRGDPGGSEVGEEAVRREPGLDVCCFDVRQTLWEGQRKRQGQLTQAVDRSVERRRGE